jgi:hypothetical protein
VRRAVLPEKGVFVVSDFDAGGILVLPEKVNEICTVFYIYMFL